MSTGQPLSLDKKQQTTLQISVSIKTGLRTTDYGLGLRYKNRLEFKTHAMEYSMRFGQTKKVI